MEFLLLGPLEVRDGNRVLRLGGAKRRALLALLALNADEVIPIDRLAAQLWDAESPRNSAASIHNHVSRLRKELGADVLVTDRRGYLLRVAPEDVDAIRFERAVAAAEALPTRERARALADALALWRGPALADLVFEPALAAPVSRLEEQRLIALERRIDAELELGRAAELVPELEALVAAEPLREHLRWQLILALYRGGRQAEALDVYRETRRLLADELGLEPGPELRELERAVLRQDPSLVPPPARTEATTPERTPPARPRIRTALTAALVVAAAAAAAYAVERSGLRAHRATGAATTLTASTSARTSPVDRARVRVSRRSAPVLHLARATAKKPARRKPKPAAAPTATRPSAPPTTTAPSPHAATTTPKATDSPPGTTTNHPTPTRQTTTRPTTIPRTTTTTGTATPPPPQPPPARPILGDPRTWWAGGDDTGVRLTQASGVLTATVAATAQPGFDGFVQTRCRASGDFDARVHVELTQWPGADGIWVSLMASDLGGVDTYRSDSFGEVWGAYVPPSGGMTVHGDEASGYLRLTRSGSTITGSFSADGATWTTIYSGAGSSAPTALSLGVFNLANVAPFAGYPASIRFDSFSLDAAALDC